MRPSVTVLIANYNYGRFLKDAIDSAVAQDYDNLSICVVDDCSTDNSWNIIEKYKDCPRRFIGLKTEQSSGPSKARNLGIENTLDFTDVYAILDADDAYFKSKVSTLVAELSDPNVGVVYADYITLNTDGIYTNEYKQPFDLLKLHNECIVHSGSLIRKQALLDVKEPTGFYDETLRTCEDYDLWLRISQKYMMIHVPEFLSLVRVGSHDSSHTVNKETWNKNYQRVMEKRKLRENIS